MNIELSQMNRAESGHTLAVAKIYMLHEESDVEGNSQEDNVRIEFGYFRNAKGQLDIFEFEIYDASSLLEKKLNFSALERLKRGLVNMCEAAISTKLYV